MLNVILKPEEVTVPAYDIDDDGGDGTEVELDGGWWEVVHSRRRISSWLLLGVAGSKNERWTARQKYWESSLDGINLNRSVQVVMAISIGNEWDNQVVTSIKVH